MGGCFLRRYPSWGGNQTATNCKIKIQFGSPLFEHKAVRVCAFPLTFSRIKNARQVALPLESGTDRPTESREFHVSSTDQLLPAFIIHYQFTGIPVDKASCSAQLSFCILLYSGVIASTEKRRNGRSVVGLASYTSTKKRRQLVGAAFQEGLLYQAAALAAFFFVRRFCCLG